MQKMMETILAECARRRGVATVPHRIFQEFAWFVGEWLFPTGESQHHASYQEEIELVNQLRKERRFVHFRKNPETQILTWAELFREYCKRRYRPMTVEEVERDARAAGVSGNPVQEGKG